MQFTFIRHGETTMNQAGILQGRLDSNLTEKGLKQAEAIALKWKGHSFDSIGHSPLLRSKQAAQAIGQLLYLPLVEYPELIERNYGPWQGVAYKEIRSKYRSVFAEMAKWDLDDHFFRSPVPGIESYHSILQRVHNLLKRIDQRVLLVTHTGVLSALLLQTQQSPPYVPIFHYTGSISLSRTLEIVDYQGITPIEELKKQIPIEPGAPFVIF